jgi:hypothetical protein
MTTERDKIEMSLHVGVERCGARSRTTAPTSPLSRPGPMPPPPLVLVLALLHIHSVLPSIAAPAAAAPAAAAAANAPETPPTTIELRRRARQQAGSLPPQSSPGPRPPLPTGATPAHSGASPSVRMLPLPSLPPPPSSLSGTGARPNPAVLQGEGGTFSNHLVVSILRDLDRRGAAVIDGALGATHAATSGLEAELLWRAGFLRPGKTRFTLRGDSGSFTHVPVLRGDFVSWDYEWKQWRGELREAVPSLLSHAAALTTLRMALGMLHGRRERWERRGRRRRRENER